MTRSYTKHRPRRPRRSLNWAVGWKGISAATLWEAGVQRQPDGTVRVPYRYPSREEHNAKLYPASGTPKCRWERSGLEQIPFGLDALPMGFAGSLQTLFIAEGESDALALRDAFAEDYEGRPITAIGLPGAGSWQRGWTGYVLPARRVYIVGDGDEPGRRMIDRVLRDVPGAAAVWLPPGEDARSVLQGRDGRDRFEELLDRADWTLRAGRRLGLYADDERWTA